MANRRRTGGPGPSSRQCRRNCAHGGTIAGSGNRGATFRRCVWREPAAGSCAVLCTGGRRPRRVWARFVLPPQHCPGPDEFQRERGPDDRHVSLISGHKPGSKRPLCHHRRVRSNAAILDGIPPLNILKDHTRADISVRLQPTVGHPPRDVDECCCDRWTQRSPDRLFGCRRAGHQRPCHRLPGRGSVRSEWVHRELPGGQPGRQSGRVDLGFAVPCQRGPPHAAHVRPVR